MQCHDVAPLKSCATKTTEAIKDNSGGSVVHFASIIWESKFVKQDRLTRTASVHT